ATFCAESTSSPTRLIAFVMRATRSSLSSTTNTRICLKAPSIPCPANRRSPAGARRDCGQECVIARCIVAAMKQLRIPAVYMRGGTSKGVFFLADDLPSDPAARDRILMRVIGSPDRYGKHTDGMGGATSSTSKVVIDKPLVDWSGNCGNLSAAVGPFAISMGLVDAPADGLATVNIWQANI